MWCGWVFYCYQCDNYQLESFSAEHHPWKKVMDFSEKYTASVFFCIKFVGGWYFSLCHTNKSCIYCHADGDSARKQYCESMIFEHQTLWVDSLDVLVTYGLPSVIQELSSFFAGETTTCNSITPISLNYASRKGSPDIWRIVELD